MGQQASFAVPVVKNNNPINFNPEIHEFESEYVQRVKQTPFVSSILYSSQPYIYIEPAQTTMEMLVAPRLNTTKLFPKKEILITIEHIFSALNELKNKNFQNYGNISLSSIFYHKQSKSFKLVNPAFFNSTNYLLVREGLKFSFLAPEELLTLSNEDQVLEKNFKTDIFIFAICMLQICTLKDSREIYCPQTYNIFDVEIKQRLKSIEQLYSVELANFLELCLVYEMDKRMDLQNGLKEIRFLKEKDKPETPKPPVSQPSTITPVLSPRGEPKKGTLPFGPGHLPKKLPVTSRQEAY